MFLFPTGRIDFTEIKQSLADIGLDISKEEAEKILQRYFMLLMLLLLIYIHVSTILDEHSGTKT